MEKELLRKLGEETIYSAKGHFKACDLRRNLVTAAIWICLLSSCFDIMNIVANDLWFDAFGLFFAIALLVWNEGDGKDYRSKHKLAGENYLSLHKEIRACFYLEECTADKVKALNQQVIDFDKSTKPEIPGIASKWAKWAIEKNEETDNWFAK